MNIHPLKTLSNFAVGPFKEAISFSGSQKIIMGLALAAFGCIALCYAFFRPLKNLLSTLFTDEKSKFQKIIDSGDFIKLLNFLPTYKEKVTELKIGKQFNSISDIELEKILKLCPDLCELSIWNCDQITDAGLEKIKNLPQLEKLALTRGCINISDNGLAHLADLVDLTELTLGGSPKITDAGLLFLTFLTNLKKLHLQNLPQIKKFEYIDYFTQLTDLELRDFDQLNDYDLANFWQLVHLSSLSLSGCKNVTDTGLELLAGVSKNISKLDLSRCEKIQNQSPEFLSKFVHLKSLDLFGCPGIQPSCLANVSSGLTWLGLDCSNYSDRSLGDLMKKFKNLECLSLLDLQSHISSKGIRRYPPSLKSLYVLGSNQIIPLQDLMSKKGSGGSGAVKINNQVVKYCSIELKGSGGRYFSTLADDFEGLSGRIP